MRGKRFTAALLCVMLAFSLLPAAVFAAEGDGDILSWEEISEAGQTAAENPDRAAEEENEEPAFDEDSTQSGETSEETDASQNAEIPAEDEPAETFEEDEISAEPETDGCENEFEKIIATGKCGDNISYTFDSEGTLSINGTGDMYSYYPNSNNAPWCPADTSYSIKKIVVSPGVMGIGSWAFSSCMECTSVSIPATVTYIGDGAFDNCRALTSVALPAGLSSISRETFFQCQKLTSLQIPEGVDTIGDMAFMGCRSLKSITFPASLSFTGVQIFDECCSLESINVAVGNTYFASDDGVLFDKSMSRLLTYPAGKSSESYTVPGSVVSVDYHAFEYCGRLKEVIISEGTSIIGSIAFYECGALERVSFPKTAVSIGYSCFVNCPALKTIDVAEGSGVYVSVNGVLYTADMKVLAAYPGGKEEQSYTVPGGVEVIGNGAFDSAKKLAEIILPESVLDISYNAFRACSNLKKINIPSGVKAIANFTFDKCSSLDSVILPESITAIGANAFGSCSSLSDITIPSTVLYIDEFAFEFCGALKTIRFKGNAPQINGTAFYEVAAEAYYPYGNSTWTQKALQNYGGMLNWKADGAPKVPVINTAANHADYMIISWNKLQDAVSYRLAYREGTGAWQFTDVPLYMADGRGNPRVNLKNLKQGANYTFIVYANFEDGTQTKSSPATQTRLYTPAVKAKAGAGYVNLAWNSVEGGSQYKIYYREKGGSWQLYAYVGKNVTSVNVKNTVITANGWKPLMNGRIYEFMVLTATSVPGITSGFPTTPASVNY